MYDQLRPRIFLPMVTRFIPCLIGNYNASGTSNKLEQVCQLENKLIIKIEKMKTQQMNKAIYVIQKYPQNLDKC
ncbi:hypothetical protein CWR45_14945 [Oceanobacillus chungangensis]|uniref:Uncharacterized protein n=1 Tax=Oceanobacillus chungangensis TaxID=1229152 RepID=A0A3D8PJA3_9BACI|nr:hypothetical protein CWR45_14945 [Oceanobacillus chungangensis]